MHCLSIEDGQRRDGLTAVLPTWMTTTFVAMIAMCLLSNVGPAYSQVKRAAEVAEQPVGPMSSPLWSLGRAGLH